MTHSISGTTDPQRLPAMAIRAIARAAIALGVAFSNLTAIAATTGAAPTIRVATKPLTVMGAATPDQARPLISVTAAKLVMNGALSDVTQSSQPIKTTTRTLVINGRSDKR